MERFSCAAAVTAGEGALSALGQQRCRRLLVVCRDRAHPLARQVQQAAGEPLTHFWEAPPGAPTMAQAVAGSRCLGTFQPELVAVLGDPALMDLGKAMVCFSRRRCTLAAIPTGIGAGSEMTDRVILAHNGRCHLLQDASMAPELVILESSLTARMPAAEVAEGGFALLCAAVEAYTAPDPGPLRDLHAREAFVSGWGALPGAFAGDPAARQRLQTASVLTGLAVNQAGFGLCCALENSLGSVFGLSRGVAAGILLPAVLGCNAYAAGRRYAALSRAAGLGGSNEALGLRNLRGGLIRLRRELGLPGTLVQAGIDIRSIWSSGSRIVELTLEDPACRNNPVTVDDFLVRRILEEITGRI